MFFLVFLATGGMGPTATTVFLKLASMLAEKWNVNYSHCLLWLLCRLRFSLLRSAVMCLQGHWSSSWHPMSIWSTQRVALTLVSSSNLFNSW